MTITRKNRRVLVLTPTCTNVEPILAGLKTSNEAFLCTTGKSNWESLYHLCQCNYDEGEGAAYLMTTAVREFKPETIIYLSVSAGPHLAPVEVFQQMKTQAKLIHICFDASCPDWHPLLETYIKKECFDLTVNIDGCEEWPKGPKDFTALAPIDPHSFPLQNAQTRWQDRSITCGFQGGDGSPQRREVLSWLRGEGVLRQNPRQEAMGTYNEYVKFMGECKMVLNLALCGSGKASQVKARVLETGLAGACLLEEKGAATKHWFTPGLDYLEYETKEDAKRKIELVQAHPEIGKRCAEGLAAKVRSKYSPQKFWRGIL